MPLTPSEEPIRLGFLVPERNVTCEAEFPRYLPDGVTAHFSRLPREEAEMTAGSLLKMMESVDAQSKLLSHIDVQVIMAACTSGSFLGGTTAAEELGHRVTAATGIPGITTSTAVSNALRALRARRLFMITPYPEDITRDEAAFFEALGFEMTGFDTFACARSEMIRRLTSDDVAEMAYRHRERIQESDALFVSCTNLETMDRLAVMEEALGKPVVSSNAATLWRAFRAVRLPPVDIGAGTLFTTRLAAGPAL